MIIAHATCCSLINTNLRSNFNVLHSKSMGQTPLLSEQNTHLRSVDVVREKVSADRLAFSRSALIVGAGGIIKTNLRGDHTP